MKRKIAFLLTIICIIATFASCKPKNEGDNNGGTDNPGTSDNNNQTINKDSYFWAEGVEIGMIFNNEDAAKFQEFMTMVYEATGAVPSLKLDSHPEALHEIVVGRSTRPISEKAYQLLEREIETEGMAGYLIYSNGTSVAIAYSSDDVFDLALEAFGKTCLGVENGVIALGKGTLSKSAFDLYDYFDECDAKLREEQWAKLEKHINDKGYDGAATVAAFKKLYSLYSDDA